MERNEISIHEVKLYMVFKNEKVWITSKEASVKAEVAWTTARHIALKHVRLGILDQAEVYPGHRYRLSKMAKKRNAGYTQRLEIACEVFGLTDTNE